MAEEKSELNRLFREARAGSTRALNGLIQRLRPIIYRKASTFVVRNRPGVGPSTITQETSAALARMITRVRGAEDGTLFSLVNKLVQTKGISAYRYQRRQIRDGGTPIPLDDVSCQLPAEQDGPEEQLLRKQRTHQMLVAIAQLPDTQRIPLEAVLSGQSPDEIAAQLGCSEAAVANRLQRAKQRLQGAGDAGVPAPITALLLNHLRHKAAGAVDIRQLAADDPEHQGELRDFAQWIEGLRLMWKTPA